MYHVSFIILSSRCKMGCGDVTMTYTYKLIPNTTDPITGEEVVCKEVVRKEDNWHIPFDPDNQMYQEYLAWVAEGNTPDPAD